MIELPTISTEEQFDLWMHEPDNWMRLANDIAVKEGFDTSVMRSFENSTNLVVNLDDHHILKVFPPIYGSQFSSEKSALRFLEGKLQITIPTIRSYGQLQGWDWLIISKLEGTVGSKAWPFMLEADKESILEQIGAAIAEVQSIPLDGLSIERPSWCDFIRTQIAGSFEHHQQLGMPQTLLADLETLMSEATEVIPLSAQPVLLTGDWIPQNVLLSEKNGNWELSGVIDFGDVMTGWGEYDLLAPNAFMCAGLPGRTQALLRGYGVPGGLCDAAMRRRLLTLSLLHAESDIRKIDIEGWQERLETLVDLGEICWP